MLDETGRKRVIQITETMVASMVAKGEVDPDDDEALKKAARKCAADAVAVYNAALEFISG